jgi:hypothetical protein
MADDGENGYQPQTDVENERPVRDKKPTEKGMTYKLEQYYGIQCIW